VCLIAISLPTMGSSMISSARRMAVEHGSRLSSHWSQRASWRMFPSASQMLCLWPHRWDSRAPLHAAAGTAAVETTVRHQPVSAKCWSAKPWKLHEQCDRDREPSEAMRAGTNGGTIGTSSQAGIRNKENGFPQSAGGVSQCQGFQRARVFGNHKPAEGLLSSEGLFFKIYWP
jgi:hypothetical protein